MKVNLPQYSFSAGALGSKVIGRADLNDLYSKALKDSLNMVATPQGPIMRRPGTKYVRRTHEQVQNTRLVPFTFDANNTYMLELSPNEIRIFKDRNPVLQNARVVTNPGFTGSNTGWTDISQGSAVLDHYDDQAYLNAAGESEGIRAQMTQQVTTTLTGINSYAVVLDASLRFPDNTDFNYVTVRIGTTSGGNEILGDTLVSLGLQSAVYFDTDINSFYITVTGTQHLIDNLELYQNVVIATDYNNDDIAALSYVVSGAKVYFATPGKQPKVLIRTSDTDWYFQNLVNIDGPYFDLADPVYGGRGSGKTLTLSAVTGDITVTASDILFNANDVGRHLRYRHVDTADWGWAIITSYISPTQVMANVKRTFADKTASTEWTLGAWGETAGYPSVVSASTGRLVWANTPTQPNGFWASRSSAPNVYSPDDNFDDNITASVAISTLFAEATDIVALASGNNKMFVGSSSGIFSITGLSEGFYGISVQRIDSSRAAAIMPVSSQGSAFFISGGLRNLYSVSYSYEQLEEGYRADDVTNLNDDYALFAFLEGALVNTPYPILWYRTAVGSLLSLTYSKADKIAAWSRHTLGGEDAFVESIAVQPRAGSDDLWLVVSRTINGATVKTIEYMTDFQTDAYTKDDIAYLDASVQQPLLIGSLTTLSGANHLYQATGVAATINGAHYSDVVLDSGGGFTPDVPAYSAVIGYSYSSEITLLHREGGSNSGSVFGRPYRVSNIHVRFWNSNGASTGFEQPSLQSYSDLIYFNESPTYGQGDELYTGWKSVRVNSGALKEVNVKLNATGSLAFNVQAVMLEVEPSEF